MRSYISNGAVHCAGAAVVIMQASHQACEGTAVMLSFSV